MAEDSHFAIRGYTPRWSLRPGQAARVHVSTSLASFTAEFCPLRAPIESCDDWEHVLSNRLAHWGPFSGTMHPLTLGSYMTADCERADTTAFRLLVRALVTNVNDPSTIAELQFEGGHVQCQLDVKTTPTNVWLDVCFLVDVERKTAILELHARDGGRRQIEPVRFELEAGLGRLRRIILAGTTRDGHIAGAFDGKLETPRLLSDAYGTEAHWDFSALPYNDALVPDRSEHQRAARLFNGPARAVTGSRWRGEDVDYRTVPDLYAAVHFHRDDLIDAGWPETFSSAIPEEAASGAYVILLSDHATRDFSKPHTFYPVPIFVTREPTGARVALVLPTFSYRAYANWCPWEALDPAVFQLRRATVSAPIYEDVARSGLLSLYDHHADGSGVHLASLLRPQSTMRPDWVSMQLGFPHQFSADLTIVRWLENEGESFDTLCDEVLHEGGVDVLSSYSVVVTGSHPEYSTPRLLDAYRTFQDRGGSMMYLGGNGFYWCIGIDPVRPEVIEVRKADGTRNWSARLGETRHQTDGEPGGTWRRRGRPPNAIVGIGFSAMGFTPDGTYALPEALDLASLPRRLHDVLRRLRGKRFGVAGLELDRYDPELAAFSDVTVIASAVNLPAGFHPPIEDIEGLDVLLPDPHGSFGRRSRGDIVYVRLLGGGACFSVGSIRWTSGLTDPDDALSVRAITAAALADLLNEGT